jgi:hypothetical protein
VFSSPPHQALEEPDCFLESGAYIADFSYSHHPVGVGRPVPLPYEAYVPQLVK